MTTLRSFLRIPGLFALLLIAIRDGKGKAVRRGLSKMPSEWELYDLQEDSSEAHDLAAANPDIITGKPNS